MFIKSVKIHNIRSYTSEEIRFSKGSLLLAGNIGAGKSTILLAIEFALFGVIRGSIDGASLLRSGKNAGYVELTFNVDKKEIIIRRNLSRSKNSINQVQGYIVINGTKTECTAVELKARVLDVLGYPKKTLAKSKSLIYRYTVYTPQEDMKKILFEESAARLDTLRKVFQIDGYKTIRENATIVSRALKERMAVLSARTEGIVQKKEQLNELIKGRQLASESSQKIAVLIQTNGNELSQSRARLSALESKILERDKLRNQLTANEVSLREKSKMLNSMNLEMETSKKQIAELEKKSAEMSSSLDFQRLLSCLKHHFSELSYELSGKRNKLAVLESKILERDKLRNQLTANEVSLREKSKMLNSMNLEMETSKKQIAELEKKSAEMSSSLDFQRLLSCLKHHSSELSYELSGKQKLRSEISLLQIQLREIEAIIVKAETTNSLSKKREKEILMSDNCPACLQKISEEHKNELKKKTADGQLENSAIITRQNEKKSVINEKLNLMEEKLSTLISKEQNLADASALVSRYSSECEEHGLEPVVYGGWVYEVSNVTKSLELSSRALRDRSKIADAISDRKELMNSTAKNVEKVASEISALNSEKSNLSLQVQKFAALDSERENLKRQTEAHHQSAVEADALVSRYSSECEEHGLEPVVYGGWVYEVSNVTKSLELSSRALRDRSKIADAISDRKELMNSTAKNVEKVASEISALNSEKSNLSLQVQKFAALDSERENLKRQVEKLQGVENKLSVDKAVLENKLEAAAIAIKELQEEITIKEDAEKLLEKSKSYLNWLEDYFVKITEIIERAVMLKIHDEFNSSFQSWFKILVEEESVSSRLDDSFSPIVEINGYEMPLKNLSGGEKSSCALAYRLALNRVINDVVSTIKTKGLLILDEPTDGFSFQQLEKVREILEQLNLPQTIIVSHEQKIESFVQSVIKVVKEQHVSRALLL